MSPAWVRGVRGGVRVNYNSEPGRTHYGPMLHILRTLYTQMDTPTDTWNLSSAAVFRMVVASASTTALECAARWWE